MIRSTLGRRTGAWALGLLLAGALMASAEQTPAEAGSLMKLKAGTCNFTVLDAQGVNPMPGLQLVLASPVDGKAVLQGTTDVGGACSLDIAAGRYVLNIKGMDLAILETSADQTIAACRIVLPEAAMVVGGAETATPPAEQKSSKKAGAFWLTSGAAMKPIVVGTVVVLAAAGGGYAIYENNNDDGDDNDDNNGGSTVTPTPTTSRPQPSSSRPREPRPPSVSN